MIESTHSLLQIPSTEQSTIDDQSTQRSEIVSAGPPLHSSSSVSTFALTGEVDVGKKKPGKRKAAPERVLVHVRLRPFLEQESGKGSGNSFKAKNLNKSSITAFDTETKMIQVKKDATDKRKYYFDSLFKPDVT